MTTDTSRSYTTTSEKMESIAQQMLTLGKLQDSIGEVVENLGKIISEMQRDSEQLPFDEPGGQTEFKVEVKTEHSFDELKNMLAEKIHEGKRDEVKNMLLWYGVHKLSELDSSKYDEVFKKGSEL